MVSGFVFGTLYGLTLAGIIDVVLILTGVIH